MATAEDLIAWIEQQEVSQGPLAGTKYEVFDWQRDMLNGLLRPEVAEAALSIARGNGKTTFTRLIAAACVAPDGPLVQRRGEVAIVASSLTQARIAYLTASDVLQPHVDADRKRWQVRDNQNSALIFDKKTGAGLRCLASDPRRAHGLQPVLSLRTNRRNGRSRSRTP